MFKTNKSLWMSLMVGAVIAAGALANNVTLPNTFSANTPAVAAQVNANFTAVKAAVDDNFSRIQALEARPTPQHLFAYQNADVYRTAANATWIDVPGASVTFTTTGASTLANASVSGVMYSVTNGPFSRCAMRVTVDGQALPSVDPTYGNLLVSPAFGNLAGADSPFSFVERLDLPAGSHTVTAQLQRVSISGVATGDCFIPRWTYGRTRLTVDTF